MGCTSAKAPQERVEAPAADNQVAPSRIPLTTRQRFSLAKSWKAIARAMEQTGVAMFIKLLEENEEFVEMFTRLKHLRSREEREESEEFKEHATTVMEALDEAIALLETEDRCIDHLKSIGKRHKKIPGFKPDFFWKMEAPFLTSVKETLDDRYTENMEGIYRTAIHFFLQTILEGFEAA